MTSTKLKIPSFLSTRRPSVPVTVSLNNNNDRHDSYAETKPYIERISHTQFIYFLVQIASLVLRTNNLPYTTASHHPHTHTTHTHTTTAAAAPKTNMPKTWERTWNSVPRVQNNKAPATTQNINFKYRYSWCCGPKFIVRSP